MNWLRQQVANVAGTQEPIYGPSAINTVGAQAKDVPWTQLEKDDMKWAALEYTNVETQSFYLMSDNGHIGLLQVIYNNVAGLHTTCQFNTKIFYPHASGKSALWCSDPLLEAEFDEERFCFHADGCAVTLNDAGDAYTIKSVVNADSIVNITIKQQSPGFVVGKDGKTSFGTDLDNPWGLVRHAFWPRCQAQGTILTNDGEINFEGRAFLSHALQGMKPHHAAARWDFINFQSESYSAVMMEFTTPPSYGSTVVNVGGIVMHDKILCAGHLNTISHTRTEQDADTDWPEPKEVSCNWTGTSSDQLPVNCRLEGSLGERLDRVDVLAKVPGFIKTIAGGVVGTRPYIYQYSPSKKLELTVTINGKESTEEGILFSEATFISE